MNKLTAALTLTAAFALPTAAFAGCGPYQLGSTSVSCEQGVQVFRTSQPHLPSISPTDSAKLELQRDALAQRRREAQARDRIERDRLALERARLRQTDYLYRDVNSPLRQRGYNSGFVGGYGGGFAPTFGPAFSPAFGPAFAPGFRRGFAGQRLAVGTPVRGQLAPNRGLAQPVAAPMRRMTAGRLPAQRPAAQAPMRAAPMKKH